MSDQVIQNVLLLSLSTIRQDKIGIFSNYLYIDESGKRYDVTGNYQLDPIPNMLKEMQIPLDHVIMLETKATKEKVDIKVKRENFCETISAADYFKIHLADKLSATGKIKEIDLDELSPESAIYEAFTYLLDLSKDSKIHLHLAAQGGFRGVQLLCSAISSLLDEHLFQITTYAVQYNEGNKVNMIIPDKTTEIFDFASGINEFTTHGTVKNLLKYLSIEENKELINPIQEISDGISWCDMNRFTDGLAHLSNYYKNYKTVDSDYLKLFEARIRDDYGPLLDSPDPDAIDIAGWCMKKGLYQQALTVIEAKTADSFFSHNIMKLTDTGEKLVGIRISGNEIITNHEILDGAVFQYRLKVGSTWDSNIDRKLFNDTFREYYPEGENASVPGTNLLKKKIGEVKKVIFPKKMDIAKTLKTAQHVSFEKIKDPGTGKNKVFKQAIDLPLINKPEEKRNNFATTDYMENLAVLLFMYKTMKDIRNKVNHAAGNPYEQKAIINSIYFFIDLANQVYEDTEKWES